jgi:F-type H+-transporting ATPase subunit delta
LKSQRQLELLPQVAEKLTQAGLTAADPNLATVNSSYPLTAKQKQALKNTLAEAFGRPIRLKTRVDPSLLGGLKIALAGKIIDTSLSRQLSQLNESILYD